MDGACRRFRRRGCVLALAALLLVPVALSGHTHVGQSTHPCSICAVTHHTPIVRTAALPTFAHSVVVLLAAPRPVRAPVRADQSPHAGRAPPDALLTAAA